MEFDKCKVYSAKDADELKIGSKIFVAKNLHALKDQVCQPNNICTLIGIRSEDYQDRFIAKFDFDELKFVSTLAYLVSEPAKLKWTDLKLGDVISRGELKFMVTGIDSEENECHIFAGDVWLDDEELAEWKKVENDC